jgi:3-hydroxyacyl-[acyl-carrier-protein] dehydratase
MSVHPIAPILAGTPHRGPMLLLDRLSSLVPGRYGRAVKALAANESHQGGSEGSGGLPPSLLVDALGQLAITVLSAGSQSRPRLWFLSALEGVSWDALPRAGDLVEMEADVLRTWRGTSRVGVTASVKGRACLRGVMVLTAGPEGASPEGGGRGAKAEEVAA